jgi:hypothetical protein
MNKKNSLEGNLLFKECGESLKLMKNGKSPGLKQVYVSLSSAVTSN